MFYVCGRGTLDNTFNVTDTDDGVIEEHSLQNLRNYKSRGIIILGLEEDSIHVCKSEGNLIFVPNFTDNMLYIYNVKNGFTSDRVIFSKIPNDRNNVYFNGGIKLKSSSNKEYIIVSCSVCVKYDYEIYGTYFILVDRNSGYIVKSSGEVLFVNDNPHDIIAETGGDCPDFLSSYGASKLLKKRGIC